MLSVCFGWSWELVLLQELAMHSCYFLTPLRNQGLTDCQHKQPAEEFSRMIQYFSLLQQGSLFLLPH